MEPAIGPSQPSGKIDATVQVEPAGEIDAAVQVEPANSFQSRGHGAPQSCSKFDATNADNVGVDFQGVLPSGARSQATPDAEPMVAATAEEEDSASSCGTWTPRADEGSPVVDEGPEEPVPKRPAACLGALEVCCGSAAFTRALAQAGFAAQGVDYKGNQDTPVAPCVWIDLCEPGALRTLKRLVVSKRAAYVHFSPPNGTTSKGRNVSRARKPLRSGEFPDGVPSLPADQLSAVERENRLYAVVIAAVRWLDGEGKTWSVESPGSSLIWMTHAFDGLGRDKDGGKFQYGRCKLDMCMHGGARQKSVHIIHSAKLDLSQLAVRCDGSHEHRAFAATRDRDGRAAMEERRYPQLFCTRLATLVAKSLGVSPLPPSTDPETKAGAGLQARRGPASRVPDYVSTPTFSEVTLEETERVEQALKSEVGDTVRGVKLWKECKLLAVESKRGDSGARISRSMTIGKGDL